MAKIEYGNPGIAGVKSLQYLGNDGLPQAAFTPTKVAGGALMAYGAYRVFTVGNVLGAGALLLGFALWRR